MRRAALLALLLESAALADSPDPTANEVRHYAGDSVFGSGGRARQQYKRALKKATRELFIYRGLETALVLRGTYLSDEFRHRMVDERNRLVGPTSDDAATFERRVTEDGKVYHEVVFSADSAVPRGDRFGGDGWQLRLVADGTEEKLVTVFKVDHPTPLQNQIYLHQTLWSELWIARFQRTVADPATVELKVGGGYGHGELVWRLGAVSR